MILSFIAAIGKNHELGFGNQLPWHLPDDLKRFKDITRGHTVLMGRKTYDSIGRPLPDRRNIIITRDTTFVAPGIEVAHSLDEALRLASLDNGKRFEEVPEEPEVFVIGGGQVFTEALPRAQKMYLSHVETALPADSFFPKFDLGEWKILSEEFHPKDEKHLYDFTFKQYERK